MLATVARRSCGGNMDRKDIPMFAGKIVMAGVCVAAFIIGALPKSACDDSAKIHDPPKTIATVCVHADKYEGPDIELNVFRADGRHVWSPIKFERLSGDLIYCAPIKDVHETQQLRLSMPPDATINKATVTTLVRGTDGQATTKTVDVAKNVHGIYALDIIRPVDGVTNVTAEPPRHGDPPILPSRIR